MKDNPYKISVAIAAYNGEKYIYKQLQSICEQTIKPDEIVISDDNSTDGTVDIIKNFKEKYFDIEFKIIRNNSGKGFAKNFINAILNTSGDFIFLSDQDDIWNLNKIEEYILCINKYQTKLVFSDVNYIDVNDHDIVKKFVFNSKFSFYIDSSILQKEYIQYDFGNVAKNLNLPGMTFAFASDLRDQITELCKSDLLSNITYHDVLISYLGVRSCPIIYINKKLVNYRLHSGNSIGINQFDSGNFNRKKWIENLLMNQEYIYEIESNLPDKNNKYILRLKKYIKWTKTRLINFDEPSIISFFKLLFNLSSLNSLKSLIGDAVYILKK